AYMKQKGLGTPATRAAIIERLLQTGYITRQRKALAPTEKGRALIEQVNEDLKDIGLTATWEQQLADIQDAKKTQDEFEKDIASLVSKSLPAVITGARPLSPTTAGSARSGESSDARRGNQNKHAGAMAPCPQCKEGSVRKTPRGAGCSRWQEGCSFS